MNTALFPTQLANLEAAVQAVNNKIADNSGGTAANGVAAIAAGSSYSQTDMQHVRDAISALVAAVNGLIVVIARADLSPNDEPVL